MLEICREFQTVPYFAFFGMQVYDLWPTSSLFQKSFITRRAFYEQVLGRAPVLGEELLIRTASIAGNELPGRASSYYNRQRLGQRLGTKMMKNILRSRRSLSFLRYRYGLELDDFCSR